jgi:hypothetical protein
MRIDKLNSIDLRSDFENDRIPDDGYFIPTDFHYDLANEYDVEKGEYIDRWVIELRKGDTSLHSIYDYQSYNEYKEDVDMLMRLNRKPKAHVYDRVEEMGLSFERFNISPNDYGKLTVGCSTVGIRIYKDYFQVHDKDFKITPQILELIEDLQNYVGKENVGKFITTYK